MKAEDLKKKIRDVPDFPKKGIIFKDITTLLQDAEAFRGAIDALGERYRDKKIDVVVGMESRGFIFASALAYSLKAGLILVRKPGKLPAKTFRASYQLEYGEDALEIHRDAFDAGAKVLIVDDLLATGGTSLATASLIEKLEGEIVEIAFLIELAFLEGRKKLKNYPIFSLLTY